VASANQTPTIRTEPDAKSDGPAAGSASQGLLGIVAGGGPFPAYVIRRCQEAGIPFYVLALKGAADPDQLKGVPQGWARPGAGARILRLLRGAGVQRLTMVGSVRRPGILQFWPDLVMLGVMIRIGWNALFGGDDALIRAIIPIVESKGFDVIAIEEILPELLADEGCYGRLAPDAEAERDIALGIETARAVGRADVGQGAVAEQGAVLAREDAAGTDAMLARLADRDRTGPGGVLVKVAKPGQQRKVDLPTIGANTVERAAAAGLRGIAIEAGSALVVDREGVAAAADEAGIFVIGVKVPEP
jgi:hypothetical protein